MKYRVKTTMPLHIDTDEKKNKISISIIHIEKAHF